MPTRRAAAARPLTRRADARKRPPSTRGVKHSDQTVSKITGAKTMRRGHRRG